MCAGEDDEAACGGGFAVYDAAVEVEAALEAGAGIVAESPVGGGEAFTGLGVGGGVPHALAE